MEQQLINETFQYNGNPITFQKGNNLMMNATEMAKPFGKRPGKWLELPSTKEFLATLSTVRKSDSDFVITINGGTTEKGKGTWMHEDVALEFARWLSPVFAIWCNDRCKELLLTGKSEIPNHAESLLANPDKYTRKEIGLIMLQAEEELEDALSRAERLEKDLKESEAEKNRLKGKLEAQEEISALKERIARIESGARHASMQQPPAWKESQMKEMPHSDEFFERFPEYHCITVPLPTPDEIYTSMTFDNVRKRLFNDLGIEFSPISLAEYLEEYGFVTNEGKDRLKPTKKALDGRAILHPVETPEEEKGIRLWQPKFTEKGYLILVSRIRENGAFDD